MGSDAKKVDSRTRIGERRTTHGFGQILSGVTRENMPGQVLAGVTLLAIAIPEQLATSQLAGVPAFTAMIAFITATLVFVVFGSNPIVSVGADSTIAPLFAVALLRLALPASTQYLELVAATALVTGLLLLAIGLFKLGWFADFLSQPIVVGFLCGIGVIIVVHQLPHVLGIAGGGDSVIQRLEAIVDNFHHVSVWSIVLALGTLAAMTIGEKINPKLPWALGAVLVGTILCVSLSLANHGVQELGSVIVGLPRWRLRWFSMHEWSGILTTALTLVIVIMSQTAATARTSADEIGVADNLSRDFVGVGMANIAAGLVGAFPVDASPARTTVTRLAGGRTKLVGIVAAVGALIVAPFASIAHSIPLAALAGVLLFVAGRHLGHQPSGILPGDHHRRGRPGAGRGDRPGAGGGSRDIGSNVAIGAPSDGRTRSPQGHHELGERRRQERREGRPRARHRLHRRHLLRQCRGLSPRSSRTHGQAPQDPTSRH